VTANSVAGSVRWCLASDRGRLETDLAKWLEQSNRSRADYFEPFTTIIFVIATTAADAQHLHEVSTGHSNLDDRFCHETCSANGVALALNLVIGGQGPAVLLLHDWPQTW